METLSSYRSVIIAARRNLARRVRSLATCAAALGHARACHGRPVLAARCPGAAAACLCRSFACQPRLQPAMCQHIVPLVRGNLLMIGLTVCRTTARTSRLGSGTDRTPHGQDPPCAPCLLPSLPRDFHLPRGSAQWHGQYDISSLASKKNIYFFHSKL